MDHVKNLRVAADRLRKGIPGTPECSYALDMAADEIERMQSRIDELMLEYCPDEISLEKTG